MPKVKASYLYIIIFLILTLIVQFIFRHRPVWCEAVYSQQLFPLLQKATISLNRLLALFHVNQTLVVILVVVALLAWRIVITIKKNQSLKDLIAQILGVCTLIFCLFYWLWGFNYFRLPLTQHMGLESNNLEHIDDDYIFLELEQVIDNLNSTRGLIQYADTIPWYDEMLPESFYNELIPELQRFVTNQNYKASFRLPVTFAQPKGVLLHWSTSGMYFPYSSTALVDSGLPLVSLPHTIAHELSHGYGLTGEGECNFIAYLVCLKSNEPLIRYSGLMHYFKYASRVAFLADSTRYSNEVNQLNDQVIEDIKSRKKCAQQFPDILPDIRDNIYDNYLKAQGVSDGLANYGQVYRLVYLWKSKSNNKE